MAVIKTFFGLILIIVFVVFGYWMYATHTTETGDDAIWAGINGLMPEVLRQWSCSEIEARAGGSPPAPQSCAEYWNVPGPEEAAAPGTEDGTDIAEPFGEDAPEAIETAPASAAGTD